MRDFGGDEVVSGARARIFQQYRRGWIWVRIGALEPFGDVIRQSGQRQTGSRSR